MPHNRSKTNGFETFCAHQGLVRANAQSYIALSQEQALVAMQPLQEG